jgi:hypothetical protein
VNAHNEGVEAQNGSWSAYIPMIADSHHFDEKADPEPH